MVHHLCATMPCNYPQIISQSNAKPVISARRGWRVGNGGGMIPRIHRCVELILYLMSSLLLDGLTTMAVVGLTQTDSNPFHHLGRMAAQCRTGNRRCCTVPAMEPNRAAVEIALPYMCGAENRAAGEVP